MDTGDTAWMLTSTALVMIMLPGLALFYGGLVRRKNVLSTIMHSFFGLALVSVVWVLVGFSLAFGPDVSLPILGSGFIGGLDFVGFNGVGLEPSTVYAVTIPFLLFAAFQLMFAAITPALITGAFAERKRFGAFVLFTVLWSILVYSPIAHWVWSVDGWLFKLGALDFAGGTVVHISSGVSALIVAHPHRPARRQRREHGAARRPDDRPRRGPAVVRLVRLQRRLGPRPRAAWPPAPSWSPTSPPPPRPSPGSSRATSTRARSASSAPPAVPSPASSRSPRPRASSPPAARLIIGLVAGGLCYSATLLRARIKVDDALDVFAVHGVGGMFGAIATGVFATKAVQAAYSRPARRQRRPGRRPARSRSAATIGYAVVGHVRHRQGRRPGPRDPRVSHAPRRPASTSPSTGRPPTRADTGPGRPPGPTGKPCDWPPSVPQRPATSRSPISGDPAMATTRRDRPSHRRPIAVPLYDARFEHDACGVGFVADAGGRSRDRVLPLALAGLAALGHRGAFGADGESSDGAGVALPLDPSAARAPGRRLWPPTGRRRLAASCRVAAPSRRVARRLVETVFAEAGLPVERWRAVPFDAAALGAAAAASPSRRSPMPSSPGPRARRGRSAPAHRRRLRAAPGRRPASARDRGRATPAAPSPSWPSRPPRAGRSSTRAWSSAAGCRELYPGPAGAAVGRLRGLPPALRDEHPPGLAARPAVPLDRPQRRDQHGPRQPRAGPRPEPATAASSRSRRTCSPPARCSRRTAPTRSRSTRRSSC